MDLPQERAEAKVRILTKTFLPGSLKALSCLPKLPPVVVWVIHIPEALMWH